jgi:acylpyruvate hydrolase
MRLFCIGKNYAEHVKELNSEIPDKPVVFMKPDTAIIRERMPFFLPDFSKEMHYEAEIVLKIAKNGKAIEERFAKKYYNEITVGIDFTARDLQNELKKKGLPWEISKAFDGSAVVGKFIPKEKFDDIYNINFSLQNHGNLLQKGNTKDVIFSFEKIICYISQFFLLREGDLIFTGTPYGVGSVKIGDELEGFIEDKKLFTCRVK